MAPCHRRSAAGLAVGRRPSPYGIRDLGIGSRSSVCGSQISILLSRSSGMSPILGILGWVLVGWWATEFGMGAWDWELVGLGLLGNWVRLEHLQL